MADTPDIDGASHDQPNTTPADVSAGTEVPNAVPRPSVPSPQRPTVTYSPVYDLRRPASPPPSAPATTPQTPPTVAEPTPHVIRAETIQIAPHPTTNRFPWSPVQNPKIPGFQPDQSPELPPVQPPAVEPPVIAVAAEPAPPNVVGLPVIPVDTLSEPGPLPGQPHRQEPMHEPGHRAVHVYSDNTREVWHVIRPSKIIKIFVVCVLGLILGGLLVAWIAAGTPTSIFDIPVVKTLMNRLVP